MNLYQFARQYRRRPWTKMDYREVLGSGITNQEEYDEVRDHIEILQLIFDIVLSAFGVF